MTWTINLTTDIGADDAWLGRDEETLLLLPSVFVACGFHAGPRLIRRLAAAA